MSMKIYLSTQPAPQQWGEKALLSYEADRITIHLSEKEPLTSIQKAARKIKAQGVKEVALTGDLWDLEGNWAFWLGFRTPKEHCTQHVTWSHLSDADQALLTLRLETIDWVREIINQPADVITPLQLAERSQALLQSKTDHLKVTKIIGDELKANDILGIYTVGKGSIHPPVLVEFDYNPTGDDNAPIFASLVGKGITFDSGGYSLKPSSFMETMRSDMGGAALLTGALAYAIGLGLDRRVKLYLCCAENMISDQAFKLGDIIHYSNGVSVEVTNTDAEGRLVLADGLIRASHDQATWLIDCATLTGAAKIAVGNDYHSLLSFDDAAADRLLSVAKTVDEPFWRLPLAPIHRQQCPSEFATINNSGAPNTAGASTAAGFLSYFVEDYTSGWLHIDCSATFRKSSTALWATGATGIGVKTLAAFLLKA